LLGRFWLFPWVSPHSREGALKTDCRARSQARPFRHGGKPSAAPGCALRQAGQVTGIRLNYPDRATAEGLLLYPG
jgi:hypothetical protein